MNRAVFLDRDGVLVRTMVRDGKPYAVRSLGELELLPDARPATERLKDAGFLLVVVTNQPDVGNGLIDQGVVHAMHERLMAELPLDAVKACFHSQSETCACRKPRPGLLIDAANELDIDLQRSFMVGDRWSDMAAGVAVGCRSVFVDRGYREPRHLRTSASVASTAKAAVWILQAASTDEGQGLTSKRA